MYLVSTGGYYKRVGVFCKAKGKIHRKAAKNAKKN